MSISLMTEAWSLQSINHTQKLVLLALADSANDDGMCFPSIAALKKKCSLSERGVQKCISELEGMGLVTKKMRNGHSTVYVVTPAQSAPLHVVHPAQRAPTPAHNAPPPPHDVHPTPAQRAPRNQIETKVETSKNPKLSETQALLLEFGIDGDLAKDFQKHRKTRKAEITKTALVGFQREADKAGIPITEAVRIAIESGWTGFNSAWDWQKRVSQPMPAKNDPVSSYRVVGR